MSMFLSYLCEKRKEMHREQREMILSEHLVTEMRVWASATATRGEWSPKLVGDLLSAYSTLGEEVTGVSAPRNRKPSNTRGRDIDYAKLEAYLRRQDAYSDSVLESLSCEELEQGVWETCNCKECMSVRK